MKIKHFTPKISTFLKYKQIKILLVHKNKPNLCNKHEKVTLYITAN